MSAVRVDQDVVSTRTDELAVTSFRAMASPVNLTVVRPGPRAESCLERAAAVIREVERTCTRFDPTSPLSEANAEPDRWHDVPFVLAAAVGEAERAYRETDGLFDPRILDVLIGWGYDRSLPFAEGSVTRDPAGIPVLDAPSRADGVETWRPDVVERNGVWRLHLGGRPIDLGGIGKGLAVRWAEAEMAGAGLGHCVDAGGDLALSGVGPDGDAWRVGVEDPAGRTEYVLVLDITDTGCATSSTKLRRWRAGGAPVHHLVDPRTRRPGGDGIAAVTVVAPDPGLSEVWSKALFLTGVADIRSRAEELGLAAAWVGVDGTVGTTTAMDPMVIWRRADV
jgi:thiamine biosynthesis lipoprotein